MLVDRYIRKHPEIKIKLKQARIKQTPEKYVKTTMINSFMFAIMITFAIYLFSRGDLGIVGIIIAFIISYFISFNLFIRRVDSLIHRRAREIDRDVIYAGRFLLIKLSAGRPLLNTIIDASESYGDSAKYFKEIVRDIELGSSVEEALQRAIMYSPSKKFKKILFQINSALRVGIDVTKFLEATIEEIENEALLEVKKYGKKLSSLTLVYLLFGIVIPSLGISLATIIGTLLGLNIGSNFFIFILMFVVLIQLSFIIVLKSIRPVYVS